MENIGVYVIDIETVPEYMSITNYKPNVIEIYKKRNKIKDNNTAIHHYNNNAALDSEFGRIIVASIRKIKRKKPYISELGLREEHVDEFFDLKEETLLASKLEMELLTDLADTITEIVQSHEKVFFVGHYIKQFDFPFMFRRFFYNNIPFDMNILPLVGVSSNTCFSYVDNKLVPCAKVEIIDLKDILGQRVYSYNIGLELLSTKMGIDNPKLDKATNIPISGRDIRKMFYDFGDLHGIARYCHRDTLATAIIAAMMIQNNNILNIDLTKL